VAEAALQKMSRRKLAGGHVVGQDSWKIRSRATFKQFDHGLARIAIDLGQPIVIDLADDSVGIPVAKPAGEVFARVPVDSAEDVEQPGKRFDASLFR
jgi:hypothetical protein